MTTVSFSELRANMASHLDRVLSDRTELVVTRGKKEAVVILPLAELEGLRETLHLLGNEANAAQLQEGIGQLDRGEGILFELPEG
ncbi:type II toxin-antitoxin system Phd/YefM family antitoxin [Enterovirga rhinocerotis]|uniref:Antitoxin n=1 Tax=Enterovirga rhinocerotis TaxID=1339210 RepID=A0A4R7BNW2_9HYPH|nr:type II toxin-antitoxin system prevent-host-death family antitoxin [Enterovirga rhinocerotis]TDR87198.1 antitoxin YefM [Enterovirga rhinocerotis]